MRARWLLPLAGVLSAPLLAGCGSVAPSSAKTAIGSHLTIYSSMPLQGASAHAAEQVVAGEKLALADVGGKVGRFTIGFVSMDDSGANDMWDPGVTTLDAKTAAKDEKTIAYIGDYDSGATAVSLPLTNQAGILQISPRSPYVGLTSAFDAGQGDPERFYPNGKRSFVRLLPGDPVQGAAQISLLHVLHVHKAYVLSDGEPFTAPLASIVAEEAKPSGIEVLGQDTVEVAQAGPEPSYEGEVEKIVESGAEAVFFSGEDNPGTVALWQELHEADPRLLLLGSSDMAESAFASQIGQGAASVTYLTSPVLPPSSYPASAKPVLRQYRERFHARPSSYVLYGYEAMGVVLAAIRAAGHEGDDRRSVIEAVFKMHDRRSVIGAYSVLPNGETTLTRYGADKVRGGRTAFWRELSVSGPHVPRA